MLWSHTLWNRSLRRLVSLSTFLLSSATVGSNLCCVRLLSECRPKWVHYCSQAVIDLPLLPSGTPTRDCHPFLLHRQNSEKKPSRKADTTTDYPDHHAFSAIYQPQSRQSWSCTTGEKGVCVLLSTLLIQPALIPACHILALCDVPLMSYPNAHCTLWPGQMTR